MGPMHQAPCSPAVMDSMGCESVDRRLCDPDFRSGVPKRIYLVARDMGARECAQKHEW